jgi:hypothetical protein
MEPRVDFSLRHGDDQWVSEVALERAGRLRGAFTRPWDLEGALYIAGEDLEITWTDTLVPLISAVCLESIPALADTGHATASRTIEYGYLRLDAEGHWIRLGGDGLPAGRLPREPLLHGFLAAAGRLIDLLLALELDGFDVRALREDRRAAIRALGTATWSTEGSAHLPPIGAAVPRREAEGQVTLLTDETLGWTADGYTVALPGDADSWRGLVEERVRPALEAGRSTVISRPDVYGYARFDVEGERVRISGDGMPDVRMPLAGVLATLAAGDDTSGPSR